MHFNAANTAFIFLSSILVMIMTPGLALFYSGMVRNKNVVSTILHSFIKLSVVSAVWIICGYSIAFSDTSINGYFGDLRNFMLNNITLNDIYSESSGIPTYLYVMFQGMFAVITSAIITGSFAERVRMIPVMIFAALWIIFVYAPVAHWVWGNGWLHKALHPLDFAGGAVVHLNAAIAGLVAALVIGKRTQSGSDAKAHNIPITILGCSLLWFGWFGFNAGSELAINQVAIIAMLNTNAGAAAGAIAWITISYIHEKKINALGIINGVIAGLVAVTPAAGYVEVSSALIIGFFASIFCYWGVMIVKPKVGYDDSLDAFGIHGIGGLWGSIATGIFASKAVNPNGADGLIHGNMELVVNQILSSFIVIAYSAVATFIILTVLKSFVRLRVTPLEERRGLDKVELGEEGYRL
ncbi:MAG: ammonia channel protein [Alphaproteobacteria bacterium 33-17]|nr:MAG: ammonia channel protein [Alphaproteobacteria bacterium 33-17]